MFRINLKLTRKSEDLLLLSPSILFRVLFVIIAVAFIAGIFTNPGDNIPIPGIILIVISIIAVFYEEKWTFNRKEKVIEYRFGLILFHKIEKIPFETIDEFNYSDSTVFRRETTGTGELLKEKSGFPAGKPVKYSVLSLITLDGKVRNLEVLKSRNSQELADKGREIAAFCGSELKT